MSQIAGNDQGNHFVLVVALPPNGLSTLSATRRIELARALRSLVARAAQATSLTVGCESEGEENMENKFVILIKYFFVKNKLIQKILFLNTMLKQYHLHCQKI